jgi:adenylylsulfate kinase
MSQPKPTQIVWHPHAVERHQREQLVGGRGGVLWLTGLSGSGKSTIANALDQALHQLGRPSLLLDGDNLRHGLCVPPEKLQPTYGDAAAQRFGLGFSPEDRGENIRRVACVAQLLASAGLTAITALVSPRREDRLLARRWVQDQGAADDFIEIFVDTPLEVCQQRDPKGLYRQALAGKIPEFTGISAAYEPPAQPDIHLKTEGATPEQLALEILEQLDRRHWWRPGH